ncbi:hypothetical protein MUO66_05800 [Candidatus Bathyarchaeota archaeon]|nr:hypothetical protein [Candidatus Bathyarchaeota archaeon]
MKTKYIWIAKIISQYIVILGLLLILISQTFTWEILKISIDALLANLGSLFLVIGVLQWIYDIKLKSEFLDEMGKIIDGNNNLIVNGLETSIINSREIKDFDLLKTAENLIIGTQYSPTFFKNHLTWIIHEPICKARRMKLYVYTANPSKQSRSGRPEGKKGRCVEKIVF